MTPTLDGVSHATLVRILRPQGTSMRWTSFHRSVTGGQAVELAKLGVNFRFVDSLREASDLIGTARARSQKRLADFSQVVALDKLHRFSDDAIRAMTRRRAKAVLSAGSRDSSMRAEAT